MCIVNNKKRGRFSSQTRQLKGSPQFYVYNDSYNLSNFCSHFSSCCDAITHYSIKTKWRLFWKKLFVSHVLAFFAASEGIVFGRFGSKIYKYVKMLEVNLLAKILRSFCYLLKVHLQVYSCSICINLYLILVIIFASNCPSSVEFKHPVLLLTVCDRYMFILN